jgi:hypothetical protein
VPRIDDVEGCDVWSCLSGRWGWVLMWSDFGWEETEGKLNFRSQRWAGRGRPDGHPILAICFGWVGVGLAVGDYWMAWPWVH